MVFLSTVFLYGSMGLVAYAYYASIGCDPIVSGRLRNPNQVKSEHENGIRIKLHVIIYDSLQL